MDKFILVAWVVIPIFFLVAIINSIFTDRETPRYAVEVNNVIVGYNYYSDVCDGCIDYYSFNYNYIGKACGDFLIRPMAEVKKCILDAGIEEGLKCTK